MAVGKIVNYSTTFAYLLLFACCITVGNVRAATECPSGWTGDTDPNPTSCYKVYCTVVVKGDTPSFAACNSLDSGANTASIINAGENTAVATAISSSTCNNELDYYLGAAEASGLHCNAPNLAQDCSNMGWADGRTNFFGGYEQFAASLVSRSTRDCAAFKRADSSWVLGECDVDEKYPVCRINAPTATTTTTSTTSTTTTTTASPTTPTTSSKSACLFGGDRMSAVSGGVEGRLVAEVQAGDAVWSVDELQGRVIQDEVYVVVHADPDLPTTFTHIRTTGDKHVRLTSEHIILTADAGEKTAERVVPGDRVYVHDDQSGGLKLECVQSVQEDIQTGIFNPITQSGRIIVNGVLVSTYPQYQGVGAAALHSSMWAVRMLYRVWPGAVTAGGGLGGMPVWARCAVTVVGQSMRR